MSNIIGSYVWYNRKNSIVKVLEYDRSNESYTIEHKGSIIETVDKFIDKNIAERCMYFFKTKIDLEEKIIDLEYMLEKLEDENKQLKKDVENILNTHKNKINELNFARIEEMKILQNIVHDAQDEARVTLENAISVRDKEIETLKAELTVSQFEKQFEKETVIINYSLENKTCKFLWKDPSTHVSSSYIDLYSDFSILKRYLDNTYRHMNVSDNNSRLVSEAINNWILHENEYIVGVYYTYHVTRTDGDYNTIVFYTNYGNVTSLNFRFFMGLCFSDTFKTLRTDKKLNVKMINIINKSINSGFKIDVPVHLEQTNKKSPEELYDFIKEVSGI